MEVRNAQIFNTSINGNLSKNGDHMSIISKLIGQELSNNSSADIYSRCRVNYMSSSIRTKTPDFVHLGLRAVTAVNELRYFGTSLPGLEGRRMDPTGFRLVILLVKLQGLE